MGEVSVERPSIVAYSAYRDFMRDMFLYRKQEKASLSFRRFAQLAGMKSPNYLQLVIQGKRNLSTGAAPAVGKALGLSGVETDAFVALVRSSHAETEDERQQGSRDYLAAVRHLTTRTMPESHAFIIGQWYGLLVRELVFLPDFMPCGKYISKKLFSLVSEAEALECFRMLLRNGYVVAQPDGTFTVADPVLDTGDFNIHRLLMTRHHSETLAQWARQLDRLDPENQERGLLNIPIASEKIPELKERIRRFQDEIIGWLQAESQPDRLVQLGVYLIPVTEKRQLS